MKGKRKQHTAAFKAQVALASLLWRYEGVPQLQHGLGRYFPYYNAERLHQALDYQTPAQVYQQGRKAG